MLLFFLRALRSRKVVRITGGRLALVEEEQILDDGAQPSVLTCNLHQLTFVLQYPQYSIVFPCPSFTEFQMIS